MEKYNSESRSILTEVDIFLKLGGDKSEVVGTHSALLIFKYPPPLSIVKKRVQVSEPKEEFYPSVTVCGGPK